MDVISAILQRDFAADDWDAWAQIIVVILAVGTVALYSVAIFQRWRRGEKTASLEALFLGLSFTLLVLPRSLYLLNLLLPSARVAALGLVVFCLLLGAAAEWRRWRRATTSGQRTLAIALYSVFTAILLISAFDIIVPVSMGRPL